MGAGVRLVVVDERRLHAEALAAALGRRGHQVLGCTVTGERTAAMVAARSPEVCLFGVAEPAAPGVFEVLAALTRSRPATAVVVLGPVPSPRGVAEAFAAGACGYVRSDERIEAVERAVLKARAGDTAITPRLLRESFTAVLRPEPADGGEATRLRALLTDREAEVLVRLAEGEDTRLIARGMGIAYSTARTHVQRVLAKLGVSSRLEAAALAARSGLLERARGEGEGEGR